MKMNRTFYVCVALAAVGLLVAPFLVLAAPTEPTMGLVQRIFYYHVPSAWLTFLSTFVCAAGSAAFLFRGSKRGDALAVASAELVVLFGLCVLVTGPLWGRKAWGAWWVWRDVRLMTTLLLWFIFVAYEFVRRYGGPGSSRLAAGLALFAALDVPVVYKAVDFWRTQHPKASVVRTLDPGMRPAFWTAMATFTALYVALLLLRQRLELARQRLDEAHLVAEEAGVFDD
jgi:heme exporter protein C